MSSSPAATVSGVHCRDDLPPGLDADGSMTFDAGPHPDKISSELQSNTEDDPDNGRDFCYQTLPLPVHVVFDSNYQRGSDRVNWTLALIQTASGRIRGILAAGAGMGSDMKLRLGTRRYRAVSSLSRDPGWIYQTVITVASSNRLYDVATTPSIRERLPFREFLAESVRDLLSIPAHSASLKYAELIRVRNEDTYINPWHHTAHAEFYRVRARLAKRAQQDAEGLQCTPDNEFPLMLEVIKPFRLGDTPKKENRRENQDLLEKLSRGLCLPLLAAPPPAVLAPLYAGFPNFSGALDIVADALALCARAPDPDFQPLRLRPMLLAGAPGIGKSAFCVALAAALGYGKTPPQEADFAVMTAAFQISGLAPSWSGSRQGLVLDMLLDSTGEQSQAYGNAIFVGNEIDKSEAGHNQPGVLMPLLTLLEPSTALRFRDEFVDRAVIDASRLVWLLTANETAELPEPLLSRVEIVDIRSPTTDEMRGIAEKMYAAVRENEAWGKSFPELLSKSVLDRLALSANPRELKRALGKALGTAARAGASCLLTEHVSGATAAPRRAIGFGG